MLNTIKRWYRKLPSFSARFHIAFGLASLVTSVVLLSMFLGFVPDRQGALLQGRIALAEAIASSHSLLLNQNDLASIKGSLEFTVERNPQLHAVEILRASDDSRFVFGEPLGLVPEVMKKMTSLDTGDLVSVPLIRGDNEWGKLFFQFGEGKSVSFFDKLRSSSFSLMIFMGLCSLPLFYFYLGKMLKELNPSTAVPARVRSALDTIAESLLVLDSRRNIVLANSAFSDLTGRPAEDMIGVQAQTLDWVHSQPDSPEFPWQIAFESGEPTRMDMVGYIDATGKERKFIVNCSPVLAAKGNVGGVLVSMDDVTELEEKEVLLRQSMEAAEAANHAKTAFMSNMSHEIRTPMTAILGFTEVLKRGYNQSEQDRLRHLNTISNSGTHLLELINDVLDLSKVESGAMEVESIDCNAALITNEVIHVLGVKAREKGIDIDMHIESNMPAHIISDPSRLRQIITNLVGNAIKFTEQGGVSVWLEYANDADASTMLIKVKDTGIGMTETQCESIFDAFTQADASITRRFGGTGLGLSISRQLAIAMGGDIIVSSKQGEGSTFMISLPTGNIEHVPMLTPEKIMESFDALEMVAARQWTFPESKLLVVDDGAENRELLSVVLGDLGIGIDTAVNGLEAVQAVEAGSYDVVLMDIQMPVMDGYQAVAKMRELGVVKPVVALTANAMKGFEKRVIDAGFSHYMTKPIDIDRLTSLLAELLGGSCVEVEELSVHSQRTIAESEKLKIGADIDSFAPIVSSLVQQNPKFAAIADQFVTRLDDQMIAMRSCIDAADWAELGKLSHWLKGSGGTVGFDQFREPARLMEEASKAADAEAANANFKDIEQIRSRIQSLEAAAVDTGAVPTAAVDTGAVLTAAVDANEVYTLDTNVNSADDEQFVTKNDISTAYTKTEVDNPVVSTLPMSNFRFRGIVERFIPKLNEQLAMLGDARTSMDVKSIADVAEWINGASGNVGYPELSTLSYALIKSAASNDKDAIMKDIDALFLYRDRVEEGWNGIPPVDKSA